MFQSEVGFGVLCPYFPLPSTTSYLSQGPGPGAGDAVVTKADSEQVNQPRNTWFQLAISKGKSKVVGRGFLGCVQGAPLDVFREAVLKR